MVPRELRKEFDPRSLWKEISKEAATWNYLSISDLFMPHWQYYLKWKQFPASLPNFGKRLILHKQKNPSFPWPGSLIFYSLSSYPRVLQNIFFPVHWPVCTEVVLQFYFCFSFLVLRSYKLDFKQIFNFFFLRFGIQVIMGFFFKFYF